MQQINDTSSIEEVLQYIVSEYGKEIYKDKQRLSNLIADLYTGEVRLKRTYRRAIMDDAISQRLYEIALKPIEERNNFYNRLVSQYTENNFFSNAFGKGVVDVFVKGAKIQLVEILSTKATKEDGEWKDEYGVIYSADRRKLIKTPNIYGDYKIREGTIIICDEAFARCDLTSIHIPNGVTTIGDYAFWCCKSLTSIHIPNGVTTIGNRAFGHCKSLTSIHIPDSVTTIGDHAFGGCESLTSIHIPNGVTTIGNSAFGDCKNLTSIQIPKGTTKKFRQLLPNNLHKYLIEV